MVCILSEMRELLVEVKIDLNQIVKSVKVGDRFDQFGMIWQVVKVFRDQKFTMACPVPDAFGKIEMVGHREFKLRDLKDGMVKITDS